MDRHKIFNSLHNLVDEYRNMIETLEDLIDKHREVIFGKPFGIDNNTKKVVKPEQPNMDILDRFFNLKK